MFSDKNSYLISTTSKYCENLQRDHGSNHVWFRIEGHVIIQKCFCTCETMKGRRYGFCKDFYGRKHTLPAKIFDQLYPKGYTPPMFSIPQNVCTPCVEEKKVDSVEIADLLQSFINRHMIGDKTTRVSSITKKLKNSLKQERYEGMAKKVSPSEPKETLWMARQTAEKILLVRPKDSGAIAWALGDKIWAQGYLSAPGAPKVPGQFNYAAYLRSQGIYCQLYITQSSPANRLAPFHSSWKQGLYSVQYFKEPYSLK